MTEFGGRRPEALIEARAGLVTFASEALQALLGLAPAEVVGRPIRDCEPTATWRRLASLIEVGNAAGSPRGMTLERADGLAVALACTVHRIPDPDGDDRVLITLRTTDAAAEDRAVSRFSQEYVDPLASSLGALVGTIDEHHRWTWVSGRAGQLCDRSADDLVGRPLPELVHPDDRNRAEAMLHDAVVSIDDDPDWVRLRIVDRAGQTRWVQMALCHHCVHQASRARHVLLRPSQESPAERGLLQAAHDRLELVLDSARLGFWDWNMVTGETVFNERWAEIVGYRLADLEPISIQTWLDLAHPDDLAVSEAAIAAHARGEVDTYDVRARMRHRDGHWVWVHDRGRIVEWSESGDPLRMTGTHEDITELQQALIELTDSEERFRTMMRAGPAGMAMVSLDRRFLQVNPALCELTGRSEAWLLEHGIDDVLHPDFRQADMEMRRRLVDGMPTLGGYQRRLVRPSGEDVWVLHAVGLIRDAEGRPRAYVSQYIDLTESREAAQLLEAAIEANEEPFFIWSISERGPEHTRLVRSNAAAHVIMPIEATEAVGRTMTGLLPPAWSGDLPRLHGALLAEAAAAGEGGRSLADCYLPLTVTEGVVRYWRPLLSRITATTVACVFRDATADVLTRQRLSHELDQATKAAHRDPLTALPNRRVLERELTRLLADLHDDSATVGVLYCDVDGMKQVNDEHGHGAGDQVLRTVARRMRAAVRAGDLIARVGGDEFIVLVPALSRPADAREVAEKLCQSVSDEIVLDSGESVRVSLSVGGALARPGEEPEALIEVADQIMYEAKRAGRNRALFRD